MTALCRRSVSSVLLPVVGKPLSFNSFRKSATYFTKKHNLLVGWDGKISYKNAHGIPSFLLRLYQPFFVIYFALLING